MAKKLGVLTVVVGAALLRADYQCCIGQHAAIIIGFKMRKPQRVPDTSSADYQSLTTFARNRNRDHTPLVLHARGTGGFQDLTTGLRVRGKDTMDPQVHRGDIEAFCARCSKWAHALARRSFAYVQVTGATFHLTTKRSGDGIMRVAWPQVVTPNANVPDGIIATYDDAIKYFLDGYQQVDNPDIDRSRPRTW